MNEEVRREAFAPDDSDAPASAAQATGVRFQVLAFLAGMTFILYLDRVCINQAAPAIQRELDISATLMGFIFGAFTLAYGLFEVPTGHLGDRHGSRGILTRIVLWWSLFTVLTGAAFGFWMLLVVRFLFGAGEAGALPNAARVLRRWFPESMRGTAQGIVTTAMLVGGAAAPVASAYLIAAAGWRWTFVVFGGLGVLWAVAFYRWYRDDPAEHPGVGASELALLTRGSASHEAAAHPPIPWRLVLASPSVWLMGTIQTCGSALFYMLISWYSSYLQKGRGVDALESGWLASLALAGGAVGCVCGGWLADYLLMRTGSARWSRVGISAVSYAVGGLCIIASIQTDSVYLSTGYIGLAFLCLQLQIPSWWATVTQISGRHVGALFGLMNSMGVVGGVTSPIFLGALVDWLGEQGYTGREQWDPGFWAYAAIMLLGSVLWLFVRPDRSAVEPLPATTK